MDSRSTHIKTSTQARLWQLALAFLHLGFTAFGGPAAHIGMMQEEFVRRRKWLDEQHFLDLIGATNLIPGPNSTEMVIHIGFLRAGWPGLIISGICFILPAMLIVIAFAWAYVHYGSAPELGWIMYGIKPVIIAIIMQAIWMLGKKALKGSPTLLAGLAALLGYFLGINELLLLFSLGLLVMLYENSRRIRTTPGLKIFPLLGIPLMPTITAAQAVPFNLGTLFLIFLKIGAVLYGSGYVLIAFLRADLVTRLGWISETQLLDAIAIGQFTPGPLFTAATFIGYLLGGVPGAVLSTVGIFLPAFIFVAISNPLIPRLRNSPWTGSLLDGINAASLGLMSAVTLQLGQSVLTDPIAVLIGGCAAFLLLRFRVKSTWLIAAGALAGLLKTLF